MLTLNALEFTVESDLNSPPGRWSCRYVESGSTSFLPGESISRSNENKVGIDVFVDGHQVRLMDGVVREFGAVEEPEGMVSTASGLDLKADLLDYRPAGPQNFRGMQILSDSSAPVPPGAIKTLQIGSNSVGQPVIAAYFETGQSVMRKVVEAAGYTASFDCYNYDLGADIPWSEEQTANDILAQLAAPYNSTERYKLDVFVDANSVVRFVERGKSTPPAVSMDYIRILRREFRRSKPPTVNGVQVRGASYRYAEPDTPPPGSAIQPGQPNPDGEPYQISYRYEDHESEQNDTVLDPAAFADTWVAETTGTRYYDEDGKETRHAQFKFYFFYIVRDQTNGIWKGTFVRNREESVEEAFEYEGPHGEMTRQVYQKYVRDYTAYKKWDDGATPPALVLHQTASIDQIMQQDETITEYDAEGNIAHQITKTYRAEEKDDHPTSGVRGATGLILEREVEQFFWYSGGRRWRTTATKNFDRTSQSRPLAVSTHTEPQDVGPPPESVLGYQDPGTGRIGSWMSEEGFTYTPYLWTLLQHQQYRPASGQVKSGPDNAQLKFSFEVLGSPADCAYFQGRVESERASVRYETDLEVLPDLNVVEGKQLTVLNNPSRWETANMFIVARGMRQEKDSLTGSLTCLSWI